MHNTFNFEKYTIYIYAEEMAMICHFSPSSQEREKERERDLKRIEYMRLSFSKKMDREKSCVCAECAPGAFHNME